MYAIIRSLGTVCKWFMSFTYSSLEFPKIFQYKKNPPDHTINTMFDKNIATIDIK